MMNVLANLTNLTVNFSEQNYFNIENFLLALFLIILNLLIVFGNLLVILALCVDHHLRTPTHHLIGSLAIADLLLGTTVLPFSAFQLYFDWWPFGSSFCDIWLVIDVLCCTASIYLVLVVSIDRLIGVTKPLRYHMIVTKKRMYLMITSVWMISLLLSLSGTFWKSPQLSTRICEVNQDTVYSILSATISFYIPVSIIIIIYYRIYKEARAQMKFLATGTKTSKDVKDNNGQGITLRVHIGPSIGASKSNQQLQPPKCTCNNKMNQLKKVRSDSRLTDVNLVISKSFDSLNTKSSQMDPFLKVQGKCRVCNNDGTNISSSSKNNITNSHLNLNFNFTNKLIKFKRERKAAKTLGIVIGCLLLCWMPFFIILPIEALFFQIPQYLFKIIFWLGYCNSAMNPFIYAFSSIEFRRAYKGILQCDLQYRKRKEIEKFSNNRFNLNILKLNEIHNHNQPAIKLPKNEIPVISFTTFDDLENRKKSLINEYIDMKNRNHHQQLPIMEISVPNYDSDIRKKSLINEFISI